MLSNCHAFFVFTMCPLWFLCSSNDYSNKISKWNNFSSYVSNLSILYFSIIFFIQRNGLFPPFCLFEASLQIVINRIIYCKILKRFYVCIFFFIQSNVFKKKFIYNTIFFFFQMHGIFLLIISFIGRA